MLPAQPNQSLMDGLAVLQTVVGHPDGIGTRQMARDLGLEPTRINRLLKTLAHLGLAQQTARRKYRPGPAIHVLAAQALFGSGLLQRAVPHLEKLHRLDLIVALGVLWRDQVCYLYHAAPGMKPSQALGRVGLFPATRSGIGMALLAEQKDLHRFPVAVRSELRQTRARGYALVEPQPGRRERSLGVVIPGGTQAAIALSGVIADQRVEPLVAELRQAAAGIGAEESSPYPRSR